MISRTALRFGILFMTAGIALTASAKTKEAKEEATTAPRTDYHFSHSVTPEKIRRSGFTVYTIGGAQVSNMRGNPLTKQGVKACDLSVSPANNRYVLVYDNKKENEAAIYSTSEYDKVIAHLKKKKYGELQSTYFTPDARKILLGGKNSTVVTIDGRTLLPIDTMKVDFAPTVMEMSQNQYYLAITDGKNVVVYNFEEKTPRQRWNFESNVTAMKFNNEGNEFAVLTDDGLLSIYDTRTFLIKQDFDDMGEGIAMDYNSDGKWLAVATAPDMIKVVNLLNPEQVLEVSSENGGVKDVSFVQDAQGLSLLTYTSPFALNARRMWNLSPYYGKLVREQVDEKMNEWMKMMPGESFEQYAQRVNENTRNRQRLLFEAEIASGFANDLLSMSSVSLGSYDRKNNVLELDFDNMPSIFLPVGEGDIMSFHDASELEFRNSKYGVMTNDKFELIYAEVYNKKNGKTYIYDNLERAMLNYMENVDNVVSLEVIQQQQMEELKLQDLRRKVLEEAKSRQVISDHTNISVNSEVVPDFDANGNKILNYKVRFSYEVEPEFSVFEDFAPGKYHVEESGAASSMLKIVKDAFEGDFAKYVKDGKKLLINIYGTADATPIRSALAYDGAYGDFEEEPVRQNGQLGVISVNKKDGMSTNEQLAFIRAAGVKDYLHKNVQNLSKMKTDHVYNIDVAADKGSEFRRITAEFLFIDAL